MSKEGTWTGCEHIETKPTVPMAENLSEQIANEMAYWHEVAKNEKGQDLHERWLLRANQIHNLYLEHYAGYKSPEEVEAKVEEAKKQQRLEDNRYYAEMIKKAVERVRIVATKRERERIFSLIDPYLQNMGGRDSEPQMWIMISERDWQGITAGKGGGA